VKKKQKPGHSAASTILSVSSKHLQEPVRNPCSPTCEVLVNSLSHLNSINTDILATATKYD